MLKLLKYEFRRAFKSTSTYVILLIFIILTMLPATVEYYLLKDAKNITEIDMIGASEPGEIKFDIEEDGSPKPVDMEAESEREEIEKHREETIKNNFSLQNLFNNLSTSGPMSILLAVFISITASKEYSSGYVKNLVTIKNYRIYQPFAKIIIAIVFTLLMIAVNLGGSAIIASILSGNLQLDWAKNLKFIAGVLVGQMAVSSLIILLGNFTNNSTTTLTVSLLLTFGIFSPILLMLDGLNFLPFKLMEYSLLNTYGGFFPGLEAADFAEKFKSILSLALPMLVIYTALNLLVLRKKDINLG